MYNDTELESLIYKWQSQPSKYTRLLIEQVHPTLRLLCEEEAKTKSNQQFELPVSASSLVNDVFIKLNNGANESRVNSVRTFYTYLSRIVQEVLLDKHRSMNAQKRNFDKQTNNYNTAAYIDALSSDSKLTDFSALIESLQKVKKVKPMFAEALTFKYFAARDVKQISKIMGKSQSSVESYLREGKALLKNALNESRH